MTVMTSVRDGRNITSDKQTKVYKTEISLTAVFIGTYMSYTKEYFYVLSYLNIFVPTTLCPHIKVQTV